MSKNIDKVFVEVDGKLINIRDLEKEQYEQFLEHMNALRIAYFITISRDKILSQ
jgi:hypothetical protein